MSTYNRLGTHTVGINGCMDEANAECTHTVGINAAMDEEDADRAHAAKMKEFIAVVKTHAQTNYNTGGWDYVVECYEDSEIAELIAGATTSAEAIRLVGECVGLHDERRQEARAEGGLDKYGDELTGYEERLHDSEGCGDARRCPRHPNVKTSSDDGMFDSECGECEYESEKEYQESLPQPLGGYCEWLYTRACQTEDDNIPF